MPTLAGSPLGIFGLQNPCPYSVLVPIALHRCDKGGKQRITQGQVGVLAETEVYRDTTPPPRPRLGREECLGGYGDLGPLPCRPLRDP